MNATRWLAVLTLGIHQLAAQDAPAPSREQLQKDWLLQVRLEAEGQRAAKVTTSDDAVGGCDGVTNGKWGFHTGEQENPWWQVDLGETLPLAYREGVSTEGRNPAQRSGLLALLCAPEGHRGVQLSRAELDRFTTWLDTYGQRAGAFSVEQERDLERLRREWRDLLASGGAQ